MRHVSSTLKSLWNALLGVVVIAIVVGVGVGELVAAGGAEAVLSDRSDEKGEASMRFRSASSSFRW